MKYWLMLIICLPGHNTCEVKFSQASYPTSDMCVQAAQAVMPLHVEKYIEGAFCEMADHQPKTYHINKGDLP